MKTLFSGFGVALLLACIAWQFLILPQFYRYPANFSYSADVISLDNFYDEKKQMYLGTQLSKTKFYYETVAEKDGTLTIRNVFDVRKMTGEKIFSVDRLYGIDAKTGKHLKGRGDKDREGYLFAPAFLDKQNYLYWHVNYDAPAFLKFKDEANLYGLKVYRYETGYRADQTIDLRFLPDVPDKKGMDVDINIQIWVEPVSGHLIKYEDRSICYYYDRQTRERLKPWNKFSNKYSTTSVKEQVKFAQKEKRRLIFYHRWIPCILLGIASILFILPFRLQQKAI